jgi:BirA family transcriptional regulator, biotin operon repressor / biotin---[acetyl-CoA-carboxylase] ligase
MADTLTPETVEPLLQGRFGRPYLYRERCESSQRLLDPSLDEGAAAVCDEQTAGRGRLGRSWSAPAGAAILCSVLLRPPPERAVAELSLVGGVAVAEAVEAATTLAAQIKWPNDVLINRRKVAGILAEAAAGAVVLGVGLNVNQARSELPADAKVAAGSLLTVDGVRRERAPILADLLLRLERAYNLWRDGGLEAVYDGLGARDFLRGRRVYVDGEAGLGIAVDRRGRLEVEIDGERRLVESGEVLFER